MDPARFDSLSRSAANRREVLARLGTGGLAAGLLAALGFRRPVTAQVACSVDIRAYVRLGPSAGIPLVPGATQAGSVEGSLEMTIAGDGLLENAVFILADGTSMPAVGQAIGHQLAVRVALDELRTLVFQGVSQQPLRVCQGPVDGSLIGPTEGDLGDWRGIFSGSGTADTGSTTGSEATSSVLESTAVPLVPTLEPTVAPTPTSACIPFTKEQVCGPLKCGNVDDGCGGTLDCGDPCTAIGATCVLNSCCTPFTEEEYCLGRCGPIAGICGDTLYCGSCAEGSTCVAEHCCGSPGTACMVGGDCCSGSCSMLNGCN